MEFCGRSKIGLWSVQISPPPPSRRLCGPYGGYGRGRGKGGRFPRRLHRRRRSEERERKRKREKESQLGSVSRERGKRAKNVTLFPEFSGELEKGFVQGDISPSPQFRGFFLEKDALVVGLGDRILGTISASSDKWNFRQPSLVRRTLHCTPGRRRHCIVIP